MNPRVSRSSALASKATGFPIAKIAARLAVGYALEEIPNDITQITPASFEPTIDYVVVKWPRFAFEKFPGVEPGPVDAHEVGGRGDGHRAHLPAGLRQGAAQPRARHRHQARRRRHADAARDARAPGERPLRRAARGLPQGRERRRRPRAHVRSTRGSCSELRALALDPERRVRRRALLQVRRHLRRRVPGAHAVLLLGLGARAPPTRSSAASARAWSSSAAGPTASARASSSTTAACTRR